MIIENEYIKANIDKHGAEMTELFDKSHKEERLWCGDARFWKRHSPVLFPNVGRLMNNTMRVGNACYTLGQHGFARDTDFECSSHTDTSAVFTLRATDDTKKVYPFDFELTIGYELNELDVNVSWKVINKGSDPMPFTIGAHPAFAFSADHPLKKDWQLYFPKNDELTYILLDPATGCAVAGKTYEIKLKDRKLRLSEELFEHDALVFDGTQITEAWLCDDAARPVCGILSKDFPNYGIWSVKDAPFVCLEPWIGRTDDLGFNGDIKDKKGITVLKPGEEFKAAYTIMLTE